MSAPTKIGSYRCFKMELENQLTDMELQSIYFRSCCDRVEHLKKAGIL